MIKFIIMTVTFFLLYLSCARAYSPSLKKLELIEAQENQETIPQIQRPEVKYTARDLQDPFKRNIPEVIEPQEGAAALVVPRTIREVASFNLEVQGLIWGGRFPQAIINNQVVKEGDTLKIGGAGEEASITSIDKDGVIFIFQGVQYKLSSPGMKIISSKESKGGKENEE